MYEKITCFITIFGKTNRKFNLTYNQKFFFTDPFHDIEIYG